jgi:hypothetical protein
MRRPNAPGKPALEHIFQNANGKTAEIRSITTHSIPPGNPNAIIFILITSLLFRFVTRVSIGYFHSTFTTDANILEMLQKKQEFLDFYYENARNNPLPAARYSPLKRGGELCILSPSVVSGASVVYAHSRRLTTGKSTMQPN